jgi:hypothetical protein
VEDSEVVEAAAVSLIPYPDSGGQDEMDLRRSRAAWEIFANRSTRGIPAQVLPLAMIALDRNGVHWIDPFLVRREVGAEHGNLPGLGFAPLSLREAHLQQYNSQLDEVVAARRSGNRGSRFAATEHLLTLPPAGRMPSACINPADFTQSFFPPTVDLDLAIIPDDELPILVEESLRLPPFDLTLTNDDLDSTAVVALIPVPRADLQRLKNSLTTLTRVNPADEAWRQALRAVDFVWYVRRRALPYRADLVGTAPAIDGGTPVPTPSPIVIGPTNIPTRLGGLGGVIK